MRGVFLFLFCFSEQATGIYIVIAHPGKLFVLLLLLALLILQQFGHLAARQKQKGLGTNSHCMSRICLEKIKCLSKKKKQPSKQ